MHKLLDSTEKDEWNNIIDSFEKRDIYFKYNYVDSFRINGDGIPQMFFLECEYGKVANVYFKRDIAELDKFKNKIDKNKFFDIVTPYGYGGILYEGEDIDKLREIYKLEFEKYCITNNIISEFIRFNPMIDNHKFLKDYYSVQKIRRTIYMDLSKGEEFIWNNLKSQNRNVIRKAIKNNLKIEVSESIESMNKLIDLYYKTMDKDHASEYYYFNKEFFYSIIKNLKGNFKVFSVIYENKVIASAIILYNDEFVHYHLSGSKKEYLKFSPNNLLVYEVAKWGVKNNKKLFHLGGGYAGDNDSLFRFKKSFSKSNEFDFWIGKRIYNKHIYDYLVYIGQCNIESNFFPKYRS